MKKILLPGLLGGAAYFAVSMVMSTVMNTVFPSLAAEYKDPNLFRAFSDPLMLLFFVHPFILMLILAWVWDKVKSVVPGHGVWQRGANFGFVVWLVATLPGMIITYGSMPYSFLMVLDWTLGSLIGLLVACAVLPRFNK